MLGIRVDEDLGKEINRYLKKSRQSKSQFVKKAIREHLDRLKREEWHDRQTLKGWDEIKEGEGIPVEAIHSFLDTWKNR